MLSAPAARLLAELRAIPGGKLCVVCAGASLGMEPSPRLKTMQEVVATSHIIHGQFHCSDCRAVELVAFLRPFSFPRRDA